MFPTAAFVLAASCFAQTNQGLAQRWRSEDVVWTQMLSASGQRVSIPVFSRAHLENVIEHGAIVALEEQLIRARLARDRDVIARILSDDYTETDSTGSQRLKEGAIARWLTSTEQIHLQRAHLRSNDGVIIVVGEQEDGTARLSFTHVYVRTAASGWQLVSNSEVRRAADSR